MLPSCVSVRKSSQYSIEQSFESLLQHFNKSKTKYLEWKINLKITGFIIDGNKYGWMFFYSQITDLRLLFHLDNIVAKLLKRYGILGKIKVKRFVRTYFEIKNALHTTNYIPNIDNYSIDDKKIILTEIYGKDINELKKSEIEYFFRKIMAREIRDIEKDVQNIS